MRSLIPGVALAGTLALAGCGQSTSLYVWGPYQDSVWKSTYGEGVTDVGADIDALNATVERAIASGKQPPPGMHAHIGMLYSQRGELDTALAAFEAEKELYPEAEHFMDFLIGRIRGEAPEGGE
ncbi:MAG: DUF4810 domain-containing protein [Planctomycetota bacterium]